MRTHALGGIGLIIATLVLSGCSSSPKTDDSARKLIGECADDDLNSKSVIYFGPSNGLGPGSIWARLGPNGGYQPLWRAKEDLGVEQSLIIPGKSFQCKITQDSKLAVSGGVSILSVVANVSVTAKNDFAKAKSIDVSAAGAAWDTLIGGPYQAKLKKISNEEIRDDVAKSNRLIVRRALRLDGYKAILDFDTSEKPEIKAKYAGKVLGLETLGDVGAELVGSWTSDDKLELTAANSIYVAGEFAELRNGEWVSTKGANESIPDLGDKWTKPYQKNK